MNEELARRAEAAGIVGSFRDYFGNETIVSDETKTALLAAMGGAGPSTATLRAAAQDDKLPPVCVVRAGAAFDLPFVLRNARANSRGVRATWVMTLENGGVLEPFAVLLTTKYCV